MGSISANLLLEAKMCQCKAISQKMPFNFTNKSYVLSAFVVCARSLFAIFVCQKTASHPICRANVDTFDQIDGLSQHHKHCTEIQ